MVGLTIRNIPEELLRRIRILAARNKRSMNSEILLIIEDGLQQRIADVAVSGNLPHSYDRNLSFEAREAMWNDLSGEWKGDRPIQELIDEVYSLRRNQ